MAMDNYANKDFEAIEAEEKGQGKHVPLLDSFIIQHYKGLDFSRYLQLYGYAKALHAEACRQGDIQKVKSFEKYVRLLETVYEELKEYELILWEDCMDIKVNPRICGKDLRRVLFTMQLFIDNYHRIEHISKAISEPGQTSEHGGITKNPIPMELCTPAASGWLQKAVETGFLDENYMPTDKLSTKGQKALFAEMFSKKTGIKNKYSPFEKLWRIKGLRQQRYKSKEATGKVKGGFDITVFFESQKR